MFKTSSPSFVAGMVLLVTATGAMAAATQGEFDNMCTEGLVQGKKIPTDCTVNTVIEGKTYCFGDEAAKTEFMKDPKANMAKAEANYSSMKK